MKESLAQDLTEANIIFVHSRLDDIGLSLAAFRVYGHLARRAGNGMAYPGIDSMAKICRCAKGTVIEAIRELESINLIEVKRQFGANSNYILTKPSVWHPLSELNQSVLGNGSNGVTHESNPGNGTVPKQGTKGDPKEGNPIKEIHKGGVTDGKPSNQIPTTDQSKRIAALFHRRLTTAWSEQEVKAYKKIGIIEPDDFTAIEKYYAAERAKGDGDNGGKHRRDLGTFLNNFAGELDRARSYRPFKGVTKNNIDDAQWRCFLKGIGREYEEPMRAMPYLRDDFYKWEKLQ